MSAGIFTAYRLARNCHDPENNETIFDKKTLFFVAFDIAAIFPVLTGGIFLSLLGSGAILNSVNVLTSVGGITITIGGVTLTGIDALSFLAGGVKCYRNTCQRQSEPALERQPHVQQESVLQESASEPLAEQKIMQEGQEEFIAKVNKTLKEFDEAPETKKLENCVSRTRVCMELAEEAAKFEDIETIQLLANFVNEKIVPNFDSNVGIGFIRTFAQKLKTIKDKSDNEDFQEALEEIVQKLQPLEKEVKKEETPPRKKKRVQPPVQTSLPLGIPTTHLDPMESFLVEGIEGIDTSTENANDKIPQYHNVGKQALESAYYTTAERAFRSALELATTLEAEEGQEQILNGREVLESVMVQQKELENVVAKSQEILEWYTLDKED